MQKLQITCTLVLDDICLGKRKSAGVWQKKGDGFSCVSKKCRGRIHIRVFYPQIARETSTAYLTSESLAQDRKKATASARWKKDISF